MGCKGSEVQILSPRQEPSFTLRMAVFMLKKTTVQRQWTLASVALLDAYTDFILSRQAMNCAPATLEFYKYTAGFFLAWIEPRGITSPHEVTARQIREYIAELVAS